MVGLASVGEERTAAVLGREKMPMVINVVTAVKILKYLVIVLLRSVLAELGRTAGPWY
jgi:hypothetical protein